MNQELVQEGAEGFERALGDDVGSPSVLPGLAEVHRRAGRVDEAEQVARRALAGEPGCGEARVVLALALLDQGRSDEARETLMPLGQELLARHGLQGVGAPPEDAVSDAELDEAFAEAQPEREQMLDADDVAEQALRHTEIEPEDELRPPAGFATHTVADLLERQGDPEGARQVRAAIEQSETVVRDGRAGVIRELERWLDNLRRPRT